MKRTATLAACAATLTLAGCSSLDSLNPFGSKPDPRTQPAPLVALDNKATATKVLWNVSVGSAAPYVLSPAVAGEAIFAAAADGTLVRIENGRQLWRINAGQKLSGGVGSDGKVVVVGTAKGDVLAFKADTGAAAWQAKVTSEILSAPLVADNLVAVRSGDSRVYAFDANDGKRRWVYQRTTPALSLRAATGMVAAPGAILSGFSGGKLVAIATNNGAAVWEATVALPKGSTELERVADITSRPVISGREVCAVAYQGRVACFDAGSAQTLWARDVSSFSGMDVDSRNAYVSDDKGNVQAYDRKSGASVWKQDKLINRGLSRPMVISNYVAVGDALGYLHLLRREDGSIAGRAALDGSAVAAEPIRVGDAVLVQTVNGNLYAISLE
ncbi:MAG: outer membrane protein assembly factor BamB [Rhodocyclaceae bacterium]|nr:MAG: outer membrane protein assembly factor BamB [Rhodocyclaceae bacterium]